MDIKATIAGGYRNRLALIALGAMLYAAWCLYDATVGYPDKQAAREAFDQVKADHPETWKTDEWPEKAKANDWDPTKEPEAMSDWNITTQWIQFGIIFPVGAYCVFSLLLWSRRYVGADDSTLYSHGGIEVPFDQITAIDASRWENKGIARVRYEAGSGEKEIVIDDWKYQRQPSDEVFERIRKAIDPDKIDGLDETPPVQNAASEAADAPSDDTAV